MKYALAALLVLAGCSHSSPAVTHRPSAYVGNDTTYTISLEKTVSFVTTGKPNCYRKVITWTAIDYAGEAEIANERIPWMTPPPPPPIPASEVDDAPSASVAVQTLLREIDQRNKEAQWVATPSP